MRVDRRIRFEYATYERGNFWIQKEKFAGLKISGYVWTGLTWKLEIVIMIQYIYSVPLARDNCADSIDDAIISVKWLSAGAVIVPDTAEKNHSY